MQAVDLRETNTPATVVNAAIERFGQLDVLVNNAGATKRGDFLELTEEDWSDGLLLSFTAQCDVRARRGYICKRVTDRSSTSLASAGARVMPSLPLAGRSMRR